MAPLMNGPTYSDEPSENVSLKKNASKEHEIIMFGPIKMEVLEDGRSTDNRVCVVKIHLPPHLPGPVQHWHQMHDETFLVIKGNATFYSRDASFVAAEGDFIVAPPLSPHTFGNESDEDVVLLSTFTPAFYINYFRLMAEMMKKLTADGKNTPEIAKRAMLQYATIQVPKDHDWNDPERNPGKEPKNFR